MQQQLIDQIAQRVGIPAEKAQLAVDVVVGYLKQHLPAAAGSQLDKALSGDESTVGGIAPVATKIGGMLGKH
jgi:hypothetical protein